MPAMLRVLMLALFTMVLPLSAAVEDSSIFRGRQTVQNHWANTSEVASRAKAALLQAQRGGRRALADMRVSLEQQRVAESIRRAYQQSELAPAQKKNVNGGPLATCSKKGMALTGFTRDGHCQDAGDDDAGSHHICIEMKKDFCTVTGQPNWCQEKMECMGQTGTCAIGNWCVCQWAFAGYLAKAGGCDQIVDLVCDATNKAALDAYEKSTDAEHKAALACIKQRCHL